MRKELLPLILQTAQSDERIRAVVMNGSRVNPHAPKDIFQDYDIVYFLTEMDPFVNNQDWLDVFGERLMMQTPEAMLIPEATKKGHFTYLMLFADGNRIDLTLVPLSMLGNSWQFESLSLVLLDKDAVIPSLPPPNESDYLTQFPSAKEFSDCCNEFWWVSTYIAKGLWRGEITYAKEMLESPVRAMFMQMLAWYIALEANQPIVFGKAGKRIQTLLSPELWQKILTTYPKAEPEQMWKALENMGQLFQQFARSVADRLQLSYHEEEAQKVIAYLSWVKNLE